MAAMNGEYPLVLPLRKNKSKYDEIIKKIAIALTGLSILQSLRLTVTGGAYAVTRFKIDPAETGLFIKMTLNTTEVFCVTGIMITTIYSLIRRKLDLMKYDNYISIVLTWMNFVSFVVIFFSYHSGGEKGHLTFYYWALVAASLMYGMHQSIVLNMITKDVSYYFVGMPLSGLIILVYHVLFRFFYKLFNKTKMEYYLVIFQIEIAMFLWLLASIFWTWAYYEYDPNDESNTKEEQTSDEEGGKPCGTKKSLDDLTFFQRLKNAWSPFLMNIMGMAFSFFFYPAIAPYEFVESDVGYKIDLCVLFISVTAATTLVLIVREGFGPNRCWKDKFSAYHYAWFLFIPFYGIMIILLVLIHYPSNAFSRYVKSHPYCIGILTIVLRTLDDVIRGISTNGVSMQSDAEDGDMASLSNCIAQILLNVFAFIGMGYIRAVRMHNRDKYNWPTEGFGWLRAVWFWTKTSCSGGWESFLESFTLNVRAYFETNFDDDDEDIFLTF
ncbi:conserved hypothetical protein [Theileria orientalis strain Shintoku]|uniref:Uncharacterized protein n=1 Tax=Theileria orientalis strain Shintoku TaxID=869250 RepID=J4CDB8_THEOR|nr:conserved hypothetical protein [Theileria orientalis strain Shintoku]BAM40867.1 conserved hypothetical protein [Theileria orientalis strain Shintoku]|eukprot:XP_009691168.1 conserved hypothetical protein [Theileria orientalis strain Shintoku]